jgi:hypothetical protein
MLNNKLLVQFAHVLELMELKTPSMDLTQSVHTSVKPDSGLVMVSLLKAAPCKQLQSSTTALFALSSPIF